MNTKSIRKYTASSCYDCLVLGHTCGSCERVQTELDRFPRYYGQEHPFKPAREGFWPAFTILMVLGLACLAVLLLGIAVSAS